MWHLSLPLMDSFNKTEAAVFPFRLCFLWAFPFISLIQQQNALARFKVFAGYTLQVKRI